MHLIVIIPCLNEEKTIADVIKKIPGKFDGVSKRSVVVVDDGSSDKTAELAENAGAIVVQHPYNQGVGAAFQTGIETALKLRADIIVNMDGDGQFNPEDITKLIKPIISNEADFVSASRFMDASLIPVMPEIKKWGNKRIAHLVSFLVAKKFYDVSCGFRAYSKEAALRLNLFGHFTYTQETFLDLAFKGLKIIEVPIKVRGVREFGKSRVASNLFNYALNTSRIILRTFRDCRPMQFFSTISLVMFIVAFALGAFFIGHYIATGKFYPHKWAGFSSGFFLLTSMVAFITGLLADMLARIRQTGERTLYYQKKRIFYSDEK